MEIKYGRKRSGIKKEIRAKIQDWSDSIDDERVKEVIKKDAILTGGSICSMLMGDKINDFDFYFRTKESSKIVANYYVRKFNSSNVLPVMDGVEPCYPEVKEETLENIKGEEEERVIIYIKSSGVASEGQEQYGYFEGLGEEETDKFVDSLNNEPEIENDKQKYRPIFLSQNAITLSNKIQVVIRFHGEPEKIHDNYDFAHATCYWDNGKQELVFPSEALECMMSYTLLYRGSLYPIASIFRMKKFITRGWRISAGQQLKIMWQISEIDLKNPVILREQLTGVDQAYMQELINALDGVEPDKITSSYVGAIIDRIFD